MDNMRYYEAARAVPKEAQKEIGAGRLKGMTDINPVWRIKKLTELFGPCGIGWTYREVKREFVPGAGDEVAVFVDIEMRYREGDAWSEPVPGTGGSKYISLEKNGLYTDDEAVKKATTDAISVAAKALGVGADVYFAADRTKYSGAGEEASQTAKKPSKSEQMIVRPRVEEIILPERYTKDDVTRVAEAAHKNLKEYSKRGEQVRFYAHALRVKDEDMKAAVYKYVSDGVLDKASPAAWNSIFAEIKGYAFAGATA